MTYPPESTDSVTKSSRIRRISASSSSSFDKADGGGEIGGAGRMRGNVLLLGGSI